MKVQYYYSDALTRDTEGNLVQLCEACAQEHRGEVEFAGTDSWEPLVCEVCETAGVLETQGVRTA